MSQITLVRHGQANTHARNEEEYDKLSQLGHQQARWLGDHLRSVGPVPGRVYCGSLTRHVETAQSMGVHTDITVDPRLNELQYFVLAQRLEEQHGIPIPKERDGFAVHMPQVFGAWQRDELEDVPERFSEFETRVRDAIDEIGAGSGPALVVTSGGLISMVMRQTLGLDIPAMSKMTLAIMNTSMHRLFPIGEQLSPVLFNAVPHLDQPERKYAQTHM